MIKPRQIAVISGTFASGVLVGVLIGGHVATGATDRVTPPDAAANARLANEMPIPDELIESFNSKSLAELQDSAIPSENEDLPEPKELALASTLPIDDVSESNGEVAAPTTGDMADLALQIRFSYEDKFAQEARDPTWSDSTEMILTEEFQTLTPYGSASLDSVECRQTMCRLVASNPYQSLQDATSGGPMTWSRANSSTYLEPDSDGTGFVLTAYIPRKTE